MERRAFLGAAAVLSALPALNGEAEPDAEEIIEDSQELSPEGADGTYADADCGSVPGGLNSVEVAGEMIDGPVSVTGIREDEGWKGVGLRWSAGPVAVGTGLEPDDARELADRLRVAAAFADGEIDAEEFGGEAGGAE